MRRRLLAAAALPVGAVGWLVAVPVIEYVALKRLRVTHPEMFDGAAALAAVLAAINQDTHQ